MAWNGTDMASQNPTVPDHWNADARAATIPAETNPSSVPVDTSILRSVEDDGETVLGDAASGGDDDDVQLLFSVPRRRKKKRKRYDLCLNAVD